MNHWSSHLLGIPYRQLGRDRAGADCWGLVRIAYAEAASIELPSYVGEYASADELAEIDSLVSKARKSPFWRQLGPSEVAQPLDLVIFRQGALETHVGVIAWRGHMLHSTQGRPSCIEAIDSFPWSTRPRSYGRHVKMEGRLL